MGGLEEEVTKEEKYKKQQQQQQQRHVAFSANKMYLRLLLAGTLLIAQEKQT